MEFQKKNDYTCIVFFQNKPPFKMQFVQNCFSFRQWLDRSINHKDWLYFNVYARRSGRYICRYYFDRNFITPRPQ